MGGKLNSARIISEADADMYMNFSISYDTCTYCDYNTVCRFDSSRNRYNYLSRLSEDDALERMKEVLNDENSDNNGNRNNGNNSSEGGENHGC